MITRTARRALRDKRANKSKTISGLDVNDPWLAEEMTQEEIDRMVGSAGDVPLLTCLAKPERSNLP